MSQSHDTTPAQSAATPSTASGGSASTSSPAGGLRASLRGSDYATGAAALLPVQPVQMDRPHGHHADQGAGQQAAAAPDTAALDAARQRFRLLSMRLQTQIPLYFTARQNPYPPAASSLMPYLLQLEGRIVALDDAPQIGICAEALQHNVVDVVTPAVSSLRGANGDSFGAARDHAAGAIADTLAALGGAFQFGAHAAAFADVDGQLRQWDRRFFIQNGPPDAAAAVAARDAEAEAQANANAGAGSEGGGGASGQSPGIVDRARNWLRGPATDPEAPRTNTQEAVHAVQTIRAGVRDVMILLRTYDAVAPRVETVSANLRNTLSWIEGPGGRLVGAADNAVRGPRVSTPGPEINYGTHLMTAAHVFANLPAANAARDAYMADRSSANALAFANAMGDIISHFGASLEDAPAPMNTYARFLSRCNGQFFSNVSRALLHSVIQIEEIDRENEAGNATQRGM